MKAKEDEEDLAALEQRVEELIQLAQAEMERVKTLQPGENSESSVHQEQLMNDAINSNESSEQNSTEQNEDESNVSGAS